MHPLFGGGGMKNELAMAAKSMNARHGGISETTAQGKGGGGGASSLRGCVMVTVPVALLFCSESSIMIRSLRLPLDTGIADDDKNFLFVHLLLLPCDSVDEDNINFFELGRTTGGLLLSNRKDEQNTTLPSS